MSSDYHSKIADALVDVLKGIGLKTVYKWAPGQIKPICAVVELPSFRRTEPDQAEDHVGANDLRLTYRVPFYHELNEKPRERQALVAQRVEEFIDAIDALTPGPQGLVLADLCTDVKVLDAEPFITPREKQRDLIGYVADVSVLTFK
jgi:hypothetical protein